VALVPLVLLADVAELDVALQKVLHLLGRRLPDPLLQVREIVSIGGHPILRIG